MTRPCPGAARTIRRGTTPQRAGRPIPHAVPSIIRRGKINYRSRDFSSLTTRQCLRAYAPRLRYRVRTSPQYHQSETPTYSLIYQPTIRLPVPLRHTQDLGSPRIRQTLSHTDEAAPAWRLQLSSPGTPSNSQSPSKEHRPMQDMDHEPFTKDTDRTLQ